MTRTGKEPKSSMGCTALTENRRLSDPPRDPVNAVKCVALQARNTLRSRTTKPIVSTPWLLHCWAAVSQ
jgi:hypothetical protein